MVTHWVYESINLAHTLSKASSSNLELDYQPDNKYLKELQNPLNMLSAILSKATVRARSGGSLCRYQGNSDLCSNLCSTSEDMMWQLSSRTLKQVDVASCGLDRQLADVTLLIPDKAAEEAQRAPQNSHTGGDAAGSRAALRFGCAFKSNAEKGVTPATSTSSGSSGHSCMSRAEVARSAQQPSSFPPFSLTSTHTHKTHTVPVTQMTAVLDLCHCADTHRHTHTMWLW